MEKVDITKFETFKTVKIGTFKTVEDLHLALKMGGVKFSFYDSVVLDSVALSKVEHSLELVEVSVKELGLPYGHGAPLGEILERATQLGLEPCPAEVGPVLRLEYLGQPELDTLFIGMRPIFFRGGSTILHLTRFSGACWLCASGGGLSTIWSSFSEFVFVRK